MTLCAEHRALRSVFGPMMMSFPVDPRLINPLGCVLIDLCLGPRLCSLVVSTIPLASPFLTALSDYTELFLDSGCGFPTDALPFLWLYQLNAGFEA